MVVPGENTKKANQVLVDVCCEHRTGPVTPISHGFIVDLDPSLMQKVFDVAERQWETNVKHHRQADDFGRGLAVAEGAALGHPRTLPGRLDGLNQSSSENTPVRHR